MKEELITFETAKLAKEKGFDMHFELYSDVKCYTPDGTFYDKQLLFQKPKRCKKRGALAPRQSELQKWLREKHGIDITIMIRFADSYGIYVHKNRNVVGEEVIVDVTSKNHRSGVYEDALETALKIGLNEI